MQIRFGLKIFKISVSSVLTEQKVRFGPVSENQKFGLTEITEVLYIYMIFKLFIYIIIIILKIKNIRYVK